MFSLRKQTKEEEIEALVGMSKKTKYRDRLKEVEIDINAVMNELLAEPKQHRDLSDIQHEGWLFVTESGKINWKKYFARLLGDTLSLYESPTVPNIKKIYTIVFFQLFIVTEEDKLTGKQIKEGLFCKQRIKIVTPGLMLDISFESDDLGSRWHDIISRLTQEKYKEEEIREKEHIQKELEPLFKYQQELLLEKYLLIIKTLTDSGFWISKEKKIREGYCYLKRQGKKSRRLYCVLYRDFLYLFKPKTTVSLNERPYDMVNLKFVMACDIENSNSSFVFSITTPLRKFYLRTKHEVALQEWVDKIRTTVEVKNNKRLAPLKPIRRIQDNHGYHYTKPINKFVSIIETFEDGHQKVHKLQKSGATTIGRSHSNDVTLTADKYVSRSHCKIVIEDNVPFLMDLGQSRDGTKLNGSKITKAPLKPGDLIGMGKSNIIFQVKNASELFSMDGTAYVPKEEYASDFESFSSSDELLPMKVKLDEEKSSE